jgi:hypothetical protein
VIPNFKSGTNLTMIQKIVCLQLLFVIINQISNQYWQSPFIFQQIRISYSAIVLSFLAIAFVIEKMNSQVRLIDLKDKELFTSFLTAAGLIGLHILVLFYMLKKFYGYGYEHDLIVLGNLFLYLFLFLFIWQKLKQFRFRQLTAILLTFSLAAKMIISGLL